MTVLVTGLVIGGGATVVVVVLVLVDVEVLEVDVLVLVDVEVLDVELDDVGGGSAAAAGPARLMPNVRPASTSAALAAWCRRRFVSATHPPQARVAAEGGIHEPVSERRRP